ncbi:MAG TPA: EAL domain-containing protein [Nitrospiria bacterium]|nr:EAL domain-containing protein [Nitrospiria bacterium]
MGIPLRVLVVEDSEEDASLLVTELQRGGYDVTFERVDTSTAMVVALNKQTWDIVFADYTMPNFSGAEALAHVKERELEVPFIFVSGTMGEETAVEAMKSGAQDYIMKNNLKRLLPTVELQLHTAAVRRERRRADEAVHYLAYHDVLTDLPNRNVFYDRMQQAILTGYRERKPLALLLLDLNRFKEVNDTFGHHCADLLLRQIGPRLRRCLRESDTVARMGGDEFAILLPNTHVEGASLTARKILKTLEAPFLLGEATIEVGVSIGIALHPDHGEEADVLYQRADMAMYVTKQAGGGYAVYVPEHEQQSPRRLMLTSKLRHAIEYGELSMHYQPQLSLGSNRIIGVEALSRWLHPDLGAIPPDQFIPLAEQTGLIKPFTQWVLKTVGRQHEEWKEAGMTLPISVNLSARNMQETQLPDQISELVQTGGILPGLLGFELTESMIMANPMRAMQILGRLNTMGIPLSIDDFGTGYSSLGYLKKLPVKTIKIDKSFIVDRVENQDDSVIVKSIINMGHSLGLEVIAEGVEDQHTQDRLASLGCDAVQGYHISWPLPSGEMTSWLKESPWGFKGGAA